jgi:TonB family protein
VKTRLLILSVMLVLQLDMPAQAVNQARNQGSDEVTIMERTLSDIEQSVFHQQYSHDIITSRVERLEKKIFGTVHSGSLQHRIDEIIVHQSDRQPARTESTSLQKTRTKPGNVPEITTESKPDADKIPPPAPPRFKQAISTDTQQPAQTEATQPSVEQASWDVSAVIDQLLKAEENADSVALDKAMDQLSQMQHPQSDISPEKVRTAESYRQRGLTAFGQNKLREALTHFKEAQNINPWDSNILNDLVRMQIKTGDLQSAVLFGPVAVLVAPSSTTAWCNLAEVFARARQYSRARGCVYLACLMSDDSAATLSAIQGLINNTSEPDVKAPFKQGLFIAQCTMKSYNDNKSGNIGQDKEIGPEADAALYKANMILACSDELRQIKPNSGIVLAVTIAQSGKVMSTEILRSSGDSQLDNTAAKAVANANLLPLPQSVGAKQQYLILLDKVVQALSDGKHG